MSPAPTARRPALLASLGIVVLVLLPGAQVAAQDEPAARDEPAAQLAPGDAEAQRLFVAGRVAYGDARYEQALALFRRAYAISPRAGLLYNIGQAADRLRLDDEAIAAFEAYLEADPSAVNALEVETRLEVLRRERARRELQPSAPPAEQGSSEPWILALGIGGGVLVVAGVAIAVGVALYDPGTAAPPVGDVGPGGVLLALEGVW